MKSHKHAVILTADKFEDLELFYPLFRLLEAGWQVDVAAPTKKEIGGEHGYSLKPTLTIDEVNPDNYAYSSSRVAFPMEHRQQCARTKRLRRSQKHFFRRTNQWHQFATDHGRLPPPMSSKTGTSLLSGMTVCQRTSKLQAAHGRTKKSWWTEILLRRDGRWICPRSCERQ